MQSKLAILRFPSHSVQISMDDDLGVIYCFKYTDDRCDLQSFTDQEAAGDWILEPFPSMTYRINLPEEQD